MPYQIYSLIRTSNTVTLTMEEQAQFAVGDKIVISGVTGGGTAAPFNSSGTSSFTIATKPDAYTVTYSQTGANGTASEDIPLSSVARYLTTNQQILVTTSVAHGIISGREVPVRISGVTQDSGTALKELIGGSTSVLYAKSQVKVANATQLILTLSRSVSSWTPVLSGGTLRSSSLSGVADFASNNVNPGAPPDSTVDTPTTKPVTTKTQETVAVKQLLKIVDNAKASDPYVQRLLNTSDTTKITTNTTTADVEITQPVSTLRSALDTVVEVFGKDLGKRRYYVNLSQQLVFERLVDVTPTYANAPYVLTTALGTPNGTTIASVNPFNLSVSYDHDTTKRGLFNVNSTTTTPAVKTLTYNSTDALGTAYTRRGAPVLDAVVDYPNSVSATTSVISMVGKQFFLERHAPVLTITAELRGAGTASWNNLGFSAGYYQSGSATYALQSRWEPGQWCSVVAPELGLNAIFRVEQVDWSLEPGSYQQVIRLTLNRRPSIALTTVVGKANK